MKVTLIKHPDEKDWEITMYCALNTVGKQNLSDITEDWKVKILKAEHSPIRELWFCFKLEIPYWVSVHFVRHHIGVNHYVQSQRNDRQDKYDRKQAPQDTLVSHVMTINAQELINMSHARLCNKASEETREVMKLMVKEVLKTNPEFKNVLVPKCVYRNGLCTEFKSCQKQ